jgi:hypothetical protein
MQARRRPHSPDRWWQLPALLALVAGSSCSEGSRGRSDGVPEGSLRDPAPYPVPRPAPPLTPVTDPHPCEDDGVLEISVEVETQESIDRLAGCERLIGDLTVYALSGVDYTPLRSLRDVEGTLMVRGENAPDARPLDGMRGLEEAGGLELYRLQLDSLEPLQGLRRLGAGTSSLPPEPQTIDKVTAPEDRPYEQFYGLSIYHCAGLTSLADLAALEELDALELQDNPELTSLAGLTRLLELPSLRLTGGVVDLRGGLPMRKLAVYDSSWTDLSLLGDARSLESLELSSNPALASLEGAQLPEQLDGLSLSNNPLLTSLHGLEALREVERLGISTQNEEGDSQLTSLEGLGGLERVGELYLYGQTQLRNLAGLEALKDIERLELSQNAALERLEGLSNLERVGSAFVSSSPDLASLSGLANARIGMLQLAELEIVDLSGLEQVRVDQKFVIQDAPKLSSLRGLPQLGPAAILSLTDLFALTDVQALEAVTALGTLDVQNTGIPRLAAPSLQTLDVLTVWQNPKLVQLSLAGLRAIGELRVLANPVLLRVDLRQLESAHQLEITNNDQLYESSLDALLELGAASAEIDHNSRVPPRLDPCPWTGDGLCDETSRLCAAGTDAADCSVP